MRDRKLVGSRQKSLLSFQFASSWETSASRELSPSHVRLHCIYEIDSKLCSSVRWIEAVSL